MTRISRRTVLGAAVALPLAACGGDPPRPSLAPGQTLPPSTSATADTTTTALAPSTTVDETTVEQAIVGMGAVAEVSVFDQPDASSPLRWTLANPIESGGPLVFLVDEVGDAFHKVLVPVRPNGSVGWVRATDISLSAHNYRIQVTLDAYNFKLFQYGKLIFETRVAVAAANAPTPGGRYYTTELLAPPNPDSVYGTFAYGLSGFSEVFTSFAGGPGQLGIHGTNDPDSIGTNASAGCIRMVNEDIELLAGFLPLGVPVEILV